MATPLFLDLDQVIRLHGELIARYGGIDGTRDIGLLHSAIAMPQASYGGYLHADIYEMEAAYLYHIVQSHAFQDGNKRSRFRSDLVGSELPPLQPCVTRQRDCFCPDAALWYRHVFSRWGGKVGGHRYGRGGMISRKTGRQMPPAKAMFSTRTASRFSPGRTARVISSRNGLSQPVDPIS